MICYTIPKSWLGVIRGEEEDTHPEMEDIRAFQREMLVGLRLSNIDTSCACAGVINTYWAIDPLPALKNLRDVYKDELAVDIVERINNIDEWFDEEVTRPFLVDVKIKRPDIWTYAIMLSARSSMDYHETWMDPSDVKNQPYVAYWVYYAILECLDRGYNVDEI